MSEKNIKSRIINKHDIENNWNNNSQFVPSQGEIIIYDIDENYNFERFKIGDGITNVINLPFVDENFIIDSTKVTYGGNTLDNFLNDIQIPVKVSQLENDSKFISEDEVQSLFKSLNSDKTLRFYCIEDVTVIVNGVSTIYPANSNVEIKLIDTDVFEVIPTSNNSILALNGFPGALGTYYPWLEGVKQFSNILFDMNAEEFYSKWSQGNQGSYQVQYAQYLNCIFWSDNAYVSDVNKRTNYTLYYTSQLPLCYSHIPDNTFKAFYLAFNVNSDPNWGNKAYRDSFAKATWATQVFSYYGARTIGIFGHDDPDFNITLPKDCRGLMYQSTAIENAGTFDAINTTNFGAKSGSWRDAFGQCSSLRNLFIKNLKVNLNVSWSPLNYKSISFIIGKAANTNKITISVSPYTYNLLSTSDFELAASKNITIELITTNYVEDKRLSDIVNKADKAYVDEKVANLVGSAPETLDTIGELATALQENKEVVDVLNEAIVVKADKTYVDEAIANIPTESDVFIIDCPDGSTISHTFEQVTTAVNNNKEVYASLYGTTIIPLNYIADDNSYIEFHTITTKIDENQNTTVQISGLRINSDNTFTVKSTNLLSADDAYTKTEIDTLLEAKANIEEPRLSGSLGLNHTGELGWTAVSLGFANEASGMYSFAEGMGNKSTGDASHSEGTGNTASGYAAHVEGYGSLASETGAHAEGANTVASGYGSHAEGSGTIASIEGQHVEGKYNIDDTTAIHIIGNGTSNTKRSNAHTVNLNGEAWYSGDVYVGSTSGTHKDEGSKKLLTEDFALIKTEQDLTDEEIRQVRRNLRLIGEDVAGKTFTINGESVVASANAEIFGDYATNIATGQWSVAEGSGTVAKGRASHAEGAMSQALNDGCHVEGYQTKATGYWSHAEGEMTTVSSYASHAEGSYCTLPDGTKRYGTASGYASHVEGGGCHTTGSCAHAEGLATTASGAQSHVEGRYTIAAGGAQHVEGIANIEDTEGKYIHIAGNGTFDNRSNAYTLDWNGNGWFAGTVEVSAVILRSSTPGSNKKFKLTIDDNGIISTEEVME